MSAAYVSAYELSVNTYFCFLLKNSNCMISTHVTPLVLITCAACSEAIVYTENI